MPLFRKVNPTKITLVQVIYIGGVWHVNLLRCYHIHHKQISCPLAAIKALSDDVVDDDDDDDGDDYRINKQEGH